MPFKKQAASYVEQHMLSIAQCKQAFNQSNRVVSRAKNRYIAIEDNNICTCISGICRDLNLCLTLSMSLTNAI